MLEVDIGGCKMKRTSVLLEFSDGVYDTLVEPLKKNRAFSKFLSALVEGYIDDPYIRAYADGNLDEYKKASVAAFDEQLDEMSESLANMGFFADELEAMSAGGKAHFASKAKQHKDDVFGSADTGTNGASKGEDLRVINERMDRIENSMSTFFSTMVTMMQSMAGSTSNVVGSNPVDFGIHTNQPANQNIQTLSHKDNSVAHEINNPVVEKYVEKVENLENKIDNDADLVQDSDASANDFMSSMLDGNMFSF